MPCSVSLLSIPTRCAGPSGPMSYACPYLPLFALRSFPTRRSSDLAEGCQSVEDGWGVFRVRAVVEREEESRTRCAGPRKRGEGRTRQPVRPPAELYSARTSRRSRKPAAREIERPHD